jgi:serine/threonine protein kinase
VLHRDLKPDNIGLTLGGDVMLFDFGLAKIASPCEAGEPASQRGPKLTGQTGSLRYMAPEVALCEPYDERADIYGLAIILWQMAAHAVPFAGMAAGGVDHFIERIARQGVRPPLQPKWPAALCQALVTCWEAEMLRRATISEALPALEGLLVELELGARPKSAGAAGRGPSKGLAALFGRRASL